MKNIQIILGNSVFRLIIIILDVIGLASLTADLAMAGELLMNNISIVIGILCFTIPLLLIILWSDSYTKKNFESMLNIKVDNPSVLVGSVPRLRLEANIINHVYRKIEPTSATLRISIGSIDVSTILWETIDSERKDVEISVSEDIEKGGSISVDFTPHRWMLEHLKTCKLDGNIKFSCGRIVLIKNVKLEFKELDKVRQELENNWSSIDG